MTRGQPPLGYYYVIFISHPADLLMCAHEDDAIMHYVTKCIIASSECATLKDEMSAGRVLNVLLLVT